MCAASCVGGATLLLPFSGRLNLATGARDQPSSKQSPGRDIRPRANPKVIPMKTISLALVAIVATAAFAGTASAQSSKKAHSPFVTYTDPYTGEPMTVYRRNYYVPSNDFEGGNFPGNYAVRRSVGECVIDLGYGRWEKCK
jgi:hypothetical protein